jgi:adenylate cyclase
MVVSVKEKARQRPRQVRTTKTNAILAEIYRWFSEGFDTADLKDSKALLEDLK